MPHAFLATWKILFLETIYIGKKSRLWPTSTACDAASKCSQLASLPAEPSGVTRPCVLNCWCSQKKRKDPVCWRRASTWSWLIASGPWTTNFTWKGHADFFEGKRTRRFVLGPRLISLWLARATHGPQLSNWKRSLKDTTQPKYRR